MSYGGGEDDVKKRELGGDDFGQSIAKIAVAQICESFGFRSFQQSALEAFAEIVIRYVRDLGKVSHFYANLAGRTDCNFFDIAQGLEDLGFSRGLASNCSCLGSWVVREIGGYVKLEEENPFLHPVPHFPVVVKRRLTPSFLQIGEKPPGKHIPAWLPAFPDPHTYVYTPVWRERAMDPRTDKIGQAKQRRKAERSLLHLQQLLALNCSALVPVDSDDGGDANRDAECSPILNTLLPTGKRDASPVVLPVMFSNELVVENRVSVLDAFAPAIEAATSGLCDSGGGEKNVLLSKRPTVHFKFGIGKKCLGVPLDLHLQNHGVGKPCPWFGRDEKDDRKRRAEQILKESMENPQDLAQL